MSLGTVPIKRRSSLVTTTLVIHTCTSFKSGLPQSKSPAVKGMMVESFLF
ncbi:hypothetical protein LDVICp044 [lymphocystis disease virus-China]|uniref:Uncharacterized protein n=1 Tax=lymphocystis disease virus-China TaxID=256729 RepID=Q678G7_9VIRU|nr:hypothetical protein LDVICp044 [lymphocystis disease virus-China]AAU10890.1 hypothetical protein [lymphocystis disease virus-China]